MVALTPELKTFGELILAVWPGQLITMAFDRFKEHGDSLSAEVTVSNEVGVLHWSRINLASANGRHAVLKALEESHPIDGWRAYLDGACQAVAIHWRTGEPSAPLVDERPAPDQWLVEGLIQRHQLNVLYADGGTGKSYLALAIGLAGLLRRPLSARWHVADLTRVLYLDWETGRRDQAARLWRLCEGLQSRPIDGAVLHRTMRRPLVDEVASIRTEVARHGVDLVIADSLAPACGPEPETAGSVVPALLALRSLGVTVLILAHVSHQSAQSKGPAKPFGSIFIPNLCRSTIEARRSEGDTDEASYVLSLYHRKVNDGRQQAPSALAFTFESSGALRITGTRADHGGASLPYQILEALKGGRAKPIHLAETLDAKPASIKSALLRLENRGKVIRLTDSRGGKGKETEWGLPDTNRFTKPIHPDGDESVTGTDEPLPF